MKLRVTFKTFYMKTNVCLCLKLHIPALPNEKTLPNADENSMCFSEERTKKHVRGIYMRNLLPLFAVLRSTYYHSNKNFRVGLSISGISLMLLEKYVPGVIEDLIYWEKMECLEILSEPWSHSIVSYFDMNTLQSQIKMHDKAVQSVFGKTPEIFINHSPAYLLKFIDKVTSLGKKAVFTNINQMQEDGFKERLLNKNPDSIPLLPINHKISQMVQRIDRSPFFKSTSDFSEHLIRKFKNTVTENKPVILVYNIATVDEHFLLSPVISWKSFLLKLIADSDILFNAPSEIIKNKPSFASENHLSDKAVSSSMLPDKWTSNGYQNEAFSKMLHLNLLMQTENRNTIIEEWNLLQDMDHLSYMNDKFSEKKANGYHFNPFSSQKEAYTKYITVLNNMVNEVGNVHDKIKLQTMKTREIQ